MKDILLIGGPATLAGVDRIDDDVLSILSVDDLYSRKAVVVWPTNTFLAMPPDPEKLADACNMKLVELAALVEKGLIPPLGFSTGEKYHELVTAVRKDSEAMDAALEMSARSQAYALLSKLVLAVSGGQNLVAVVSKCTPPNAMRWVNFPEWWSDAQGREVRDYTSSEVGYGVLNAVGNWPLVYHRCKSGPVKLGDLVPRKTFLVEGHKICYDANSYLGAENALTSDATISFPVTDRVGGARAIKLSGGKGYMLVVPEPDKIRNFVIGLKTSKSVKKRVAVEAVDSKPKTASASDDKYMTVKEAAMILKCSTKSIRNYYGDGRLKYEKLGQRKILILRSSVDALRELHIEIFRRVRWLFPWSPKIHTKN